MDYHSVYGNDIASFDVSGTQRPPTVAASQALDELEDEAGQPISTGLESLDKALLGLAPAGHLAGHGGIRRGQVAEIWGPPGTGKTALAIQMAANTMCDGHGVVWVDCFQKVPRARVARVIESVKASRDRDTPGDAGPAIDWAKFAHYSCLTLPHLMALISQPIGDGASLVVLSSISSLLNSALPKPLDGKTGSKAGRGPTAAAKRAQGLQYVMNALQKLAATRNCAVVILSQCASRMHSEQGATLVAAVNATVWEQGISIRLVLFRDWVRLGAVLRSVFLAGLQKLDGKATGEAVDDVCAFDVEPTSGVATVAAAYHGAGWRAATGPADLVRRKRKLGQTELEVPDSDDDEDYGWADEDEAALPAPPPQWQGSEDLLGDQVGRSDDSSGTDDDERRSISAGEAPRCHDSRSVH